MAVKVVNILKDGTIVEDMSTVTVPREIVKRVAEIHLAYERMDRRAKDEEKKS